MPDHPDTVNTPPSSTEALSSSTDLEHHNYRITHLYQQEQNLKQQISSLQKSYEQLLGQQTETAQRLLEQWIQLGLEGLREQRHTLQVEVEQLERRRDSIQAEMRTNFAGASQDLAVRVQGFKDYLVGSLQDLATAAEQLELAPPHLSPHQQKESLHDQRQSQSQSQSQRQNQRQSQRSLNLQPHPSSQRSQRQPASSDSSQSRYPTDEPQSIPPNRAFEQEAKQIRQILDQYRLSPAYYGMPWQLRRTFEPIHAERVSQWFFDHGGRGSLKSMGSRLQNILIASAIISVLRMMQDDRIRTLVLSDSPERLGEWRRGLQECLGISRSDFGAQQGIALFEAPEAVSQRADRLMSDGNTPLILIDNSEDKVHLSLLQYPLWLAFAPVPTEIPLYY